MDEESRLAYDTAIERLRCAEFPQLSGSTYLDHAAATLYPKSLVDGFASDMLASLYGNPHSESPPSQRSSSLIDDIRLRALDFFNAPPESYDLVFVPNATAGIKLVADALRASPRGFCFAYHEDSHTSVVGVREEGNASVCLDHTAFLCWLHDDGDGKPSRCFSSLVDHHSRQETRANDDVPILVAYPAQSNMSGRRYPIDWAHRFRKSRGTRTYTLVDAAALAATSPLDLRDSRRAPDFTVVSFTKIFGFPDLAGLIVRLEVADVFYRRKYFGGGTVDAVVCSKDEWHASKSHPLHARLEDGTLPIHNILALQTAFQVHTRIYTDMASVAAHTNFLASRLYSGLRRLRHWHGSPVCVFYSEDPGDHSPAGPCTNGPVVAFNVVLETGEYISPSEFNKLATTKNVSIRTGGLCNPGGMAAALGLQTWEIKRNFSSGLRCGQESDLVCGKPTGLIRASIGAMSTLADVENFVDFIREHFQILTSVPKAVLKCEQRGSETDLTGWGLNAFQVSEIYIYPIKSCAGFPIPSDVRWEVRPEGLAWDREWVLLHRGTGRALTQKQYPRMALIRPIVDITAATLTVSFDGCDGRPGVAPITIPIAHNQALYQQTSSKTRLPVICGDNIPTMIYGSKEINGFFSAALGVQCELGRFPPGQEASPARLSRAQTRQHQQRGAAQLKEPEPAGAHRQEHRILFANEGAILLVNTASVEALNEEIRRRGGDREIVARAFRPNVVISAPAGMGNFAYSEDHWDTIHIGGAEYTMAGACRRCQMVCVDQQSGERHQEPLATLANTRRFGGKTFFGTHLYLSRRLAADQHITVGVGDNVQPRWVQRSKLWRSEGTEAPTASIN